MAIYLYCIHCGWKLPVEANFCMNCGEPVPDEIKSVERSTARTSNPNQGRPSSLHQDGEDQTKSETRATEMSYEKDANRPTPPVTGTVVAAPNPETHDPVTAGHTVAAALDPGFQTDNPSHPESGTHLEKLKIFVGNRVDFYFKKWGNVDHPNKQSWNWAAFFLTIFWLGYRRMYRYLFMIMGGYLALNLLIMTTHSLLLVHFINDIVGLAIGIFLGVKGNALYLNHAKRQISAIEARNLSPAAQNEAIQKSGGTSGLGVFIAISLAIIFTIIYATILGAVASYYY